MTSTGALDRGSTGTTDGTRVAGDPDEGPRGRADVLDRVELAVVAASVVAVAGAIVGAAVRAVAGDWRPIGDNAYFALRARDVLTEHHPLLGTWTSASLSFGTDVNNPSPLLFDWLALPARIDPYAGVAVGVALLNLGAIALTATFAWRLGGRRALAGSMAAAGLVAWAMGSEVLIEPWQPHSLLLPSLSLLVLCWAMACGHLVALPWAVGVASLIVGTHLSYVLIVPAAGLIGVVGLVLHHRRTGGSFAGPPSRRPPRLGPVLAVTGVVVVACWTQSVVEQVTAEGQGNLAALAGSTTAADTSIGPGLATRLVATGTTTAPWDVRQAFTSAYRERQPVEGEPGRVPALERVPSMGRAIAGTLLVVAALAGAGAWAARRRDRIGAGAAAVAVATLAAGWVSTVRMPINPALPLGQHQMRWIWPVVAFGLAGIAVAVTARWRRGPLAMAGVAVLLGVLTLPHHNARTGPVLDLDATPTVRALGQQLAEADLEGPLLIDLIDVRFAEPYSTPVMLELQRLGIPFVTDDPSLAGQLGDSRLIDDPGEATGRLTFADGAAVHRDRPGARAVALVEGLDADERAELEALEAVVRTELAESGITLSGRGERAVALGALDHAGDGVGLDEEAIAPLVTGRQLVIAVHEGFLAPGTVTDAMARWAHLARQAARSTAAVFLEPIAPAP
jgi:hypothetical protein